MSFTNLIWLVVLGSFAPVSAFHPADTSMLAASYAATALMSASPEPSIEVLAQRDRVGSLLAAEAPDMAEEMAQALATTIVDEARTADLDPMFVMAMIAVESNFKMSSVSQRGASGLMQLMPQTRKWMMEREVDLQFSDEEPTVRDVRLGIRYYSFLLKVFHRPERALAAYNCGPTRIVDLTKAGLEMPAETKAYPKRVFKAHNRFAQDFTKRTKNPVLAVR